MAALISFLDELVIRSLLVADKTGMGHEGRLL